MLLTCIFLGSRRLTSAQHRGQTPRMERQCVTKAEARRLKMRSWTRLWWLLQLRSLAIPYSAVTPSQPWLRMGSFTGNTRMLITTQRSRELLVPITLPFLLSQEDLEKWPQAAMVAH